MLVDYAKKVLNFATPEFYLTLDLIKEVCGDFKEAEKWSPNHELFDLGKKDYKIFVGGTETPPVGMMSSLFYEIFVVHKKLLSWQDLRYLVNDKFWTTSYSGTRYNSKDLVMGRLFQSYAGLIRELRFAQSIVSLDDKIEVKKNFFYDMTKKIDFYVSLNDKMTKIGIAHDGDSSIQYYEDKKSIDEDEDVIRLTAWRRGQGIHLIMEEDILTLYKSMSELVLS